LAGVLRLGALREPGSRAIQFGSDATAISDTSFAHVAWPTRFRAARWQYAELRRKGRARARPATPRKLAVRTCKLRDDGVTWQAIADALNAEGVATARGGLRWRPSSVRSAYQARRLEILAQTA
jgi:hypothetical protein